MSMFNVCYYVTRSYNYVCRMYVILHNSAIRMLYECITSLGHIYVACMLLRHSIICSLILTVMLR